MSKAYSEVLNQQSCSQQILELYEKFPYPRRNPEDERLMLLPTVGEKMTEINHWLFRGSRDFNKDFRILVAGGGTGDAAIFIAEQLKSTSAEIIYLDFSGPSAEIAKKRAEIRKLKNITWVVGSILNIPNLNLGKFDFIDCTGVLHHLSSPDEGLKILSDSLKEDGGMVLQVYANIGRTGVNYIHKMMQVINSSSESLYESIANTKSMLRILPPGNWFKKSEALVGDHKSFGDMGVYYMFVHEGDKMFNIDEMHQFVTKAELNFVDFANPLDRVKNDLHGALQNFPLSEKLDEKLSISKKHRLCELINGDTIKHHWYVSKKKESVADFKNFDNVPILVNAVEAILHNICDVSDQTQGKQFTLSFNLVYAQGLLLTLPKTKNINTILKNIDQNKSIGEIFEIVKNKSKAGVEIVKEDFAKEVESLLKPLIKIGIMLLKNKHLPKIKDCL